MEFYYLHGDFLRFDFGVRGALHAAHVSAWNTQQTQCWMASLVKEASPDEEKMAGWSRIGIRRKAAAEPARIASNSAGGRYMVLLFDGHF